MPETLQRPRTLAIPYDEALRYMVPSARDPDDKYLVELDSYGGNGSCCCTHFAMRCEPLLRRSVSPRTAVKENLIKLKINRHVESALQCEHILTARSQFLDEVLEAIAKTRRDAKHREKMDYKNELARLGRQDARDDREQRSA